MGKRAVGKLAYYMGVAVTTLIMILTLIASQASNYVPGNSTFIPFLGLAYPALYLLNVILLIVWAIRLKIWLVIPLLAIVCGYFSLKPLYSPSFFSKGNEQGNFRIASYNVGAFNSPTSDSDAKDLAQFMKEEKVDVICMQEFVGNAILNDSLLRAAFSYWPYSYIPSASQSIIRPAIFSRYPISDKQLITFKDSKNCAIMCDLNVNGKRLRLLDNHLQTTDLTQIKQKGPNDMQHKEFYLRLKAQAMHRNFCKRAEQAEHIQSLVLQSPYPVILCGDFNDSPFSYTYKTMLGNLKDGFITNGTGYASSYRYAKKMFRIDYIFYSEQLKGTKYFTTEFGESDHYPVIMELKI